MDEETEALVRAAARNLRKGRWFMVVPTRYGLGLVTPAREDVLAGIEEGWL